MKKLLFLAFLMLALVVTAVSCSDDKPADTTAGETTVEQAPGTTAEPAPDTTAEPAPETTAAPETTVAPETTAVPETTKAPETTAEPETNAPDAEPEYGNPNVMSVCADNVRTWVGDAMTDLCTQEAHKYLNEVSRQIVIDGVDAVSFRGWANPTGVKVAQFGYQIDDGELVFDSSFLLTEDSLKAAVGPDAERFENIKIPVGDLPAGTYEITLLVKDNHGTVYVMNGSWGGDILLIKN